MPIKYIDKYWTIIIVVFVLFIFIKPAVCILIVGLLAFIYGIDFTLFLKRIKDKGLAGVGRILSYDIERGGYKTPIIEFTPIGGNKVTAKPYIFVSTDLSKIRSYSKMIDRDVQLLYDPDNPEKFLLSNEKVFNYIGCVICILAGLFSIVLGFYILLGYIDVNK